MTESDNPALAGKANAATSYAPRYIGFTTPQELACSRGHHIREDAFVFEDGALRCKYREPLAIGKGGATECGRILYVVAGWQPRGLVPVAAMHPRDLPAETILFVAEVAYREIREMQRLRLDVDGVLRFLGVRFPLTALAPAQ